MKTLFAFLAFCTTAFCAVQTEAPHIAPGSSTPQSQITPGAGPRVDHGIDAFITGDFIYWTARMDGLAYVITGNGNQVTSVGKGSVKYPDWSWDPGFKAGIGLNLPHDEWDVYGQYTWYHSSASDTTDLREKGMLTPWNVSSIISLLQSNETVQQARGEWDIRFYTIDVSLGRNYFISRCLTLRPSVGFKGGWIDQDYTVRYTLNTPNLDSVVRMKNDQDYWGIGLRAGLNTAWHIDPSWSLYGDLTLAALWSQFEVTRADTRNDSNNAGAGNPPVNTEILSFNSEDEFHTIKGILEFGMGLRGEWWFLQDRYHFMIQAGWEEQLWLNHNQLLKTYLTQSAHGDLILQGLTIKLRFDF